MSRMGSHTMFCHKHAFVCVVLDWLKNSINMKLGIRTHFTLDIRTNIKLKDHV